MSEHTRGMRRCFDRAPSIICRGSGGVLRPQRGARGAEPARIHLNISPNYGIMRSAPKYHVSNIMHHVSPIGESGGYRMQTQQAMLEYLDHHDEKLSYLAREIWAHPEIALEERFACGLLANELEAAGFTVERGIGQLPTAFVASWGSGAPIIGILGEYDALPGLSQQLSADRSPIQNGGPGHGCGHNLFGVACLGAALALKAAMEEQQIAGTIRYYGC